MEQDEAKAVERLQVTASNSLSRPIAVTPDRDGERGSWGKSGSSPDNYRPSRARNGHSVTLGMLLARPALPSPVNRALSIKVESPA